MKRLIMFSVLWAWYEVKFSVHGVLPQSIGGVAVIPLKHAAAAVFVVAVLTSLGKGVGGAVLRSLNTRH